MGAWSNSPIAQARKTGLMTQEDMSKKLGISCVALSKYECHPEKMQLRTLKEIYGNVPDMGKRILQEYVNENILQ